MTIPYANSRAYTEVIGGADDFLDTGGDMQ